ncbi:MAG: Thermolysin metallopeptidase [Gammaproteobacteria bacterium]|nr:Thermolysin metallopeptidase [Gammaproteobacteria bacterium]
MSKLVYALLGAGALVAVASLGSRVVAADTLSGSSSSSSSSSSGYGPDCSGAAASLGVIWPPNHTMVTESIVGVTDAFGLPTTITVTGIQQDEPVEARGSGNTGPDGSGVGTSTASVRAERAGPGTGRIYFISFTATNTQGAQCSGMVEAFVPHDQGQGFTPVDTGQRYDSTVVAN